MWNSRNIFIACALVAGSGLAGALLLSGYIAAALIAAAAGLVWALAELLAERAGMDWLRQSWLSNTCLALIALGGVWLELIGEPWWLALAILIAGLAAWDLFAFRRRVFWQQRSKGGAVLRAYRAGGNGLPAGQGIASQAAYPLAYPESQNETGEVETDTPMAAEAATEAESVALDRAHLRALGSVTGAGAISAVLLYLIAGVINLRVGLGSGLGLSLLLSIALILLMRMMARSN